MNDDADYVRIEAYIARARRMRSAAVGEYMASACHATRRVTAALTRRFARAASLDPKADRAAARL